MLAVSLNPLSLKYIIKHTLEICCEAVKNDYNALEFAKIQNEAMCLKAVTYNNYLLRYVLGQTENICLAAIEGCRNSSSCFLTIIKDQTPLVCLSAAKKFHCALKYIKEQTEELCIIAINHHPEAIRYVRKQTEQLCAMQFTQTPIQYSIL